MIDNRNHLLRSFIHLHCKKREIIVVYFTFGYISFFFHRQLLKIMFQAMHYKVDEHHKDDGNFREQESRIFGRSWLTRKVGGWEEWITHQIILISILPNHLPRLIHSPDLSATLSIHITIYRLDDRIIPSKEIFASVLFHRLRRRWKILKIVINWMLSGENWPIRVGRSAFPAPKVFIGVIDLPAKRELIGLSVSRPAIR